jgi:hypothetical protein
MKAKFVNEAIGDLLKPKSDEEVYRAAEEADKLGLLHGWWVIIKYPGRTTYLADYDIGKEEFKFTDDENKAYPFHYYQQASYISKLMDSKYFMQINTSKVEKIPSKNMPTTLSRTDDGFEEE